jgi:hypothetical protein
MIRVVHSGSPHPDPVFYPSRIQDSGFKKAPDPGSGSATLLVRYGTYGNIPNDCEPHLVQTNYRYWISAIRHVYVFHMLTKEECLLEVDRGGEAVLVLSAALPRRVHEHGVTQADLRQLFNALQCCHS